MGFEIFLVDVFTGDHCRGNRAGVCIPGADWSDKKLQAVAKKVGASETAFVHADGDSFSIRWFTPTMEVDLCGHATLAAAAWLWSLPKYANTPEITFESRSGPLRCRRSEGDLILVELPELAVHRAEPEVGLFKALGIASALFVGKSKSYFLVEVESEKHLRQIAPKWNLLKDLDADGVFVTTQSDSAPYDFVSRCFFPKEGIPEDPVTGSAHCSLGPYWRNKTQKHSLRAFQASDDGGDLRINFGDSSVILGGTTRISAQTVLVSP